jgi:hypothetical protein
MKKRKALSVEDPHPLDLPDFLKRGKGNTRPEWLRGPGTGCFVLPKAQQVIKDRDAEIREQVKKEIEERRENRAKNRAATRKATPKDLTGLVWDATNNRFVVANQYNIEKAIRKLSPDDLIKLHNEMVLDLVGDGNKTAVLLSKKTAKGVADLAARCYTMWGARKAARKGLIVDVKKAKPPRAPRPPGAKRAPKKEIPESARIKILIRPNPHNAKTGGRHAAYNIAAKCKTYGEYLKKGGDVPCFARMLACKSVGIE